MDVTITEAMKLLKANRRRLTKQQFNTLKGQAITGDPASAIKGLRKILGYRKEKTNETEATL